MLKKLYFLCAICLVIRPDIVSAYPKADKDFAALPKYCYVRMRGAPAEKAVLDKRFGHKTYIHLHHYCSGLDYLNKAKMALDMKARDLKLVKAIKQFDYVAERMPSRSVVLPENYYNRGVAMKLLNDIAGSLKSFHRSIELNKKYTRAYSAISDIYVESGNKEDAIRVLEKGLKLSPTSKALNRRLKKLE